MISIITRVLSLSRSLDRQNAHALLSIRNASGCHPPLTVPAAAAPLANQSPTTQPLPAAATPVAIASQPASSYHTPALRASHMTATSMTNSRKRTSPAATPSTPAAPQPPAATRAHTRRCGFPECVKTAKPGGFCIAHGGGKKCAVSTCTTSVVSRGFCVAHGGGKRCQRTGCTKSAQTGGHCWIHGGGKKCGVAGCSKRAQSGGACIAHGGGKRCRVDGCAKVVQFDGLCVGHGGFRKCRSVTCDKKALANSFCVAHGGHSQCNAAACTRKAVKGGLCHDHKSAVAAAAAAGADAATDVDAITPVPSDAATAVYSSHCIEPRSDKQQQQQQQSSSSRRCATDHSIPTWTPNQTQTQYWPQPFPGASPVKTLPRAWQLTPRAQDGQYAFAKDRPSLHMETPVDGVSPSSYTPQHQTPQSRLFGPSSGSSRSSSSNSEFVVSPLLPALRSTSAYSPLPALSDLQAQPSLPLGKRRSPATSGTGISSSSPHPNPNQPIKRLASLANIAKLSRPLTPLASGRTPLSAAQAPRVRSSASRFCVSASLSAIAGAQQQHERPNQRHATRRVDSGDKSVAH